MDAHGLGFKVLSPSYSQSLAVTDCHPEKAVGSKCNPKNAMQIGGKVFFGIILAYLINSSLACALKMQCKYVGENLFSISLACV